MIVVIQCAATKRSDAGHFQSADGKSVIFVADPRSAPASDDCVYVRPDDHAQNGVTWRDLLLSYNRTGQNPLGLYPAYRLYENHTYQQLADRFGLDKLYILSAGWGLIVARATRPLTLLQWWRGIQADILFDVVNPDALRQSPKEFPADL